MNSHDEVDFSNRASKTGRHVSKLSDRLKLAYKLLPNNIETVLELGSELTDIGNLPKLLLKKCKRVYLSNIDQIAVKNINGGFNV